MYVYAKSTNYEYSLAMLMFVYVYIAIQFCDSAWSFWKEANMSCYFIACSPPVFNRVRVTSMANEYS
jgi:hypothetical protein